MDKKFWESKKIKMALIGAGVEGLLAFLIALAANFEIEIPVVVLAYIAGIFGVSIGGQAGVDFVRDKRVANQAPQSSIREAYTQSIGQPPAAQGVTNVPIMETGTWSADSVSEDVGEANGTAAVKVDLDGLEQAFRQELAEKERLNDFTLYSRFQARANSYDLRSVPEGERVQEALRWNCKLIQLLRASFKTFIGFEAPLKVADPRQLLAEIKKSKPCGEYVGESERVHVYELWRLYQHEDALMSVQNFNWDRKFGAARVTPWQLGERAKSGLL